MATNQQGKSTVFIGNIPYGLTEEQIVQILSSVGQVTNFRLIYDSDTGRPKGFGFAEFSDVDSAASAVRNLNDYEVMNRQLRVAFSHKDSEDNNEPPPDQQQQQQRQLPPSQNGHSAAGPPPPQANGLPPLPPGADIGPNITCPDAISRTLDTLPPQQLLDILSQLKGLVMQDPAKATELLSKAPQLSYAIFQALLLMNLIEPKVLAGVIEQAQPPAPQAPPPQQIPQPRPTPMAYGQPPPPPQQYGGYPPPQQQMQPPMGHVATPPVQGGMYQPPPQQMPPQQPSKEELLQQLLSLPQHEIDKLNPLERQQIMELKQRLNAGRY